ncbi:MAG: glycine cleavage T C-terminal barrel domain-containing protein [Xanthomonadales bacterium]|nr:glycine cleavage T C-terminal barrel domain-containing protein [Xanthomonadales bacterium]
MIAMDMSFMGEFRVQGRDAGAFLDYLSANEVNGETGRITYTQWLNEAGRLEADLTVIKVDENDFIVVTSDIAHRHTETWMKRHIAEGRHVFVPDVTSGYGQLNIPSEQALHVYDRVMDAGKKFGLKLAGLKALASLRLEKGYRDYGHDIDNMDDPYSTGLGFAVKTDKPGGFIGQQASIERKAAAPYRGRMVQVLLKDFEPLMFHQEIVLRDGVAVGHLRAASYGHTLGGACVLAQAGHLVDIGYVFLPRYEIGAVMLETEGHGAFLFLDDQVLQHLVPAR